MNFLRKTLKGVTSKVVASEYIQARSTYSAATHILRTADGTPDVAICGYENCLPTNRPIDVNVTGLISTLPNQHDGWFWCSACASKLTGLTPAEIRAYRK